MEIRKTPEEVTRERLKNWKDFVDFLQTSPLYKKVEGDLNLDEMKFNNLLVHCRTCQNKTTHKYNEEVSDIQNSSRPVSGPNSRNVKKYANGTFYLKYECQHCNSDHYAYLVTVSSTSFSKTGQNPALEVGIPKDIQSKLGSLASLYKKGKTSYSHGFGIGAMAYYRRVVEDKLKELLQEVTKIVPDDKKEEFNKTVNEVSDIHSFKERAQYFTSAMPPILNSPSGNYFQLLFSAVSENLHTKSDSECLDQAELISEMLEEIIHRIDNEVVAQKSLEKFSKKINEYRNKK